MQNILFFLCIFLIAPSAYQASTTSGSLELDELTFDKIISKFSATLVKFDVAFPYGDKHDAYVALAKDAKDVDLLVAQVGVKDYGEKDNEALAKKYGATKENFPVVRLFVKGESEPIPFDDTKGFTSDNLRQFVRSNTGLYLSLPGCVRELDQIAIEFMKSDGDTKKKILKEAEDVFKALKEKDTTSGTIYKTIMEKVVEKGDEFVKTEYNRVKKLLLGKVSDEKKKQLGVRINILKTFRLPDKNKIKSEKQDL